MRITLRALLPGLAVTLFLSGAAQDTTNRGTEFWVGYGHHQAMENTTNSQQMTLYLSTGLQAAVVTVTIDSSGASPAVSSTWWRRTYNIPANTVIDIQATVPVSYSSGAGTTGGLPKSGSYDARLYTPASPVGSSSVGLLRKRAIHIESDVPIAAYSHIYSNTSSGATMLVPVQAWGGLYYSANSNQSYASDTYSWLFIIAKYDNTVIEITPSVKTRAQNVTGLQQGVSKTITLMKGQIYQLMGANLNSDADGNGGSGNIGYELTGTRVKSVMSPSGYIHPIAVFSGSSRTLNVMGCGSSGGDNDMQQHYPRQALGKLYLTAPTSQSANPAAFMTNAYKVVVSDPATVVTRNGVALTGLVNNSYYSFESNAAELIQADQPVLVAQFMGGGAGCNGMGSGGDPEMFYLSPLSQSINTATFARTSLESITVNYLTLVIPTAGLATLSIDGSGTFDHSYPHPQMAGYTVVVKKWTASKAQCIVECAFPFTGLTYGLGTVESYGFNIGAKLNAVSARDASVLPAGFTGEVLPVTLLDFTGRKHFNDAALRWSTTNEINLDRFELERCVSGLPFTRIALVQPAAAAGALTYEYTDKEIMKTLLPSQVLFYRLKMIDRDGSFRYSGILSLKPGPAASLQFLAAPNPFRNKLTLQVQTGTAGVTRISVRNMDGRLVQSLEKTVQPGSNVIELITGIEWGPGVYIVEMEFNGERRYLKIVKQ